MPCRYRGFYNTKTNRMCFNKPHQLFFIRRAALKNEEYSPIPQPKKEKKEKETKTPKKKTG